MNHFDFMTVAFQLWGHVKYDEKEINNLALGLDFALRPWGPSLKIPKNGRKSIKLLAPLSRFLHMDLAMVPMIFTGQSLANLVLWMCQKFAVQDQQVVFGIVTILDQYFN